jgi:hypothetical protein
MAGTSRTRLAVDNTPSPSPAPSPVSAGKGIGTVAKTPGKEIGTVAKAPAVSSAPVGGGGYGGGALNAVVSPTAGLGDDTLLAGDSTYQAQLAALQQALSDSNADFTNQQTKYNTNYGDSLKNLGWIQPVQDDPSTPDVNEAAPGSWNFQDPNTAAGRAYGNQQNDFASRGLLQSTLYANANDNLNRSLNDQLGSVNTGRQSFLDDLATQQKTAQNQNTASMQQARADALARAAAGLSLA